MSTLSPLAYRKLCSSLLRYARKIMRENDPETGGTGGEKEGTGTRVLADALREHADSFAADWEAPADVLREQPGWPADDAGMAPLFVGTFTARTGRGERLPCDRWPEVLQAAARVAATTSHSGPGRVHLSRPFLTQWSKLVTAAVAPQVAFRWRGLDWTVDRARLAGALATLARGERTKSHTCALVVCRGPVVNPCTVELFDGACADALSEPDRRERSAACDERAGVRRFDEPLRTLCVSVAGCAPGSRVGWPEIRFLCPLAISAWIALEWQTGRLRIPATLDPDALPFGATRLVLEMDRADQSATVDPESAPVEPPVAAVVPPPVVIVAPLIDSQPAAPVAANAPVRGEEMQDMEAKELNKLLASLKANLSVFGAGTGAVLCVLYQQGGAKGKIAQGKGADLETALSAALTAAGKVSSVASA